VYWWIKSKQQQAYHTVRNGETRIMRVREEPWDTARMISMMATDRHPEEEVGTGMEKAPEAEEAV
jgi:hypothetical protein